VLFGGPSVEHDVSIITAQQVLAALSARHTAIPLYLARDGALYTGDELGSIEAFTRSEAVVGTRVELRLGRGRECFVIPSSGRFRGDQPLALDVVINAIHGTGGEDGALLGALELAGIPYAGRGVAASAVAMDKALAKAVMRDRGIAVLDHVVADRADWHTDPAALVARVIDAQDLPCVVKPATLGSSVGVSLCDTSEQVDEALELAFELDRQALVEPLATGAVEMNVAVIGRPGGQLRASEVEQPVATADVLTFEDKYLRSEGKAGAKQTAGGGKGAGMAGQQRLIPPPISETLRERVRQAAIDAHAALRFAGVVRYDFFVFGTEPDARIVLNEPNTVPGSFAYYLFEPIGLPCDALVEELVAIAIAEDREARQTTRVFASSLLAKHTSGA
jgi:D-alanine-D-alanine ligase